MRVNGSVLALPFSDIDTDQIVPAAYLTGIDERGLGQYLFDGQLELTRRRNEKPGAAVLVALENFGCGSSREHAVWALRQAGFQAVVACSFSRIFMENSYNNGLIPIVLKREDVGLCMDQAALDIDVAEETIICSDGRRIPFALDPLRKLFLLEGGYLQFVHAKLEKARAWARRGVANAGARAARN
jgi:3-isopropylmalate/(R)-2-methylmalate dehydratase small subunit